MAEGVGFEPTVQLPVHGISSAAPSATRPPLRAPRRLHEGANKNWRRGEDLNPRGTYAPIRFRVGRLQPGSATPPRTLTDTHSIPGRPTTPRLTSPDSETDTGSGQSRGEAIVIRVPSIPFQPTRVPAFLAERRRVPQDGRERIGRAKAKAQEGEERAALPAACRLGWPSG
jgi:hypothetical protein